MMTMMMIRRAGATTTTGAYDATMTTQVQARRWCDDDDGYVWVPDTTTTRRYGRQADTTTDGATGDRSGYVCRQAVMTTVMIVDVRLSRRVMMSRSTVPRTGAVGCRQVDQTGVSMMTMMMCDRCMVYGFRRPRRQVRQCDDDDD